MRADRGLTRFEANNDGVACMACMACMACIAAWRHGCIAEALLLPIVQAHDLVGLDVDCVLHVHVGVLAYGS